MNAPFEMTLQQQFSTLAVRQHEAREVPPFVYFIDLCEAEVVAFLCLVTGQGSGKDNHCLQP